MQAPQARLVQLANQHSVHAVWFDIEISERLTASLIQTTTDGDPPAVHTHVASWTQVTSAGDYSATDFPVDSLKQQWVPRSSRGRARNVGSRRWVELVACPHDAIGWLHRHRFQIIAGTQLGDAFAGAAYISTHGVHLGLYAPRPVVGPPNAGRLKIGLAQRRPYGSDRAGEQQQPPVGDLKSRYGGPIERQASPALPDREPASLGVARVPRQHRNQRRGQLARKRPLVRLAIPYSRLGVPIPVQVFAGDRWPLHPPVREATVRLRDLAPQHGGIWLMPPGRVKDPAIALETCGHKRQHAFGEPAQPRDDPGRSTRVWRALIVTDPQHAPILPGTRAPYLRIGVGVIPSV